MTELVVDRLSLDAGSVPLVRDVSFRLETGELVAVLGPNGAGKTSLLRGALGLEKPVSGKATLDGVETWRLPPMRRARLLAYLPQTRPLAWPNVVRDVVALGRFAHGAALGRLSPDDRIAVERALDACDLQTFAERRTDTLSGGEIARVHCARAMATEAPFLVADEPVAALDPRHQFKIMDLTRSFVREGGGALVVLHDLNLAARYADRLIWMKDGQLIADGSPAQTLSVERIAGIYGIQTRIDGTKIEIEGAL